MDAAFWHRRWESNEIGFHQGEANALLVRHFAALLLPEHARIFVPLCGKTRDIAWLLSRGYRVVGAELSRLAVEQLFEELGVEPETSASGPLLRFAAGEVEVFVGDVFDLTAAMLGAVAAVYDRAALVALPAGLRERYAAHVAAITRSAPQFLICMEYDQTTRQGPPFSIDGAEVTRVHGARYQVTELARAALEGGLKGAGPVQETVWLLR
ncbi:MAG TPA: thiopurine S-methyltransferase [Amaricoccus sp.]|uniref:thiopurine S-methyltransferase n=1 Tax=Amaricoccus sp. TaxID=1872485 RepID=UPI002B8DFF7F|nr:thiopurine S-methyltransferase [Amaricoccus sp.]HMQ94981.1 thiopurine S-methyltransferase [Amaricoccus sp.]HMR52137.1 thiopurine S-methyltransferase [Amaricoccus sp.]HMR62005.1 thiopurine S-methyltransferase [Amaricoccus sp.]HMT98989.1 thiopurine S-methyltransferase [Amaricoccus sp.]